MALLNPSPPAKRTQARIGTGLALVAALAAGSPCALAQVDESQVKAAFVYNIVAFASWSGAKTTANLRSARAPAARSTTRSTDSPVAPLGKGASACDAASIRLIAMSSSMRARMTSIPADFAQPVLVICDGCRPRDGLTAVMLVREGNRIRFDVDPQAAARSGISFSSQLLRLARRVM